MQRRECLIAGASGIVGIAYDYFTTKRHIDSEEFFYGFLNFWDPG